jgi:hypothetical protein
VIQKSIRSGSLFLWDGQYVGSPMDRCVRLFLSIALCTTSPLGETSLDHQSVCLALQTPATNQRHRVLKKFSSCSCLTFVWVGDTQPR